MIPVTITKQKVTYRQTGAQGAHTDKRLVTERRRESALELTWSTEGIQSQTHGPKPAVQQARTKVHISLRHATRSFIHIHIARVPQLSFTIKIGEFIRRCLDSKLGSVVNGYAQDS